jgi:hypothetical protein
MELVVGSNCIRDSDFFYSRCCILVLVSKNISSLPINLVVLEAMKNNLHADLEVLSPYLSIHIYKTITHA